MWFSDADFGAAGHGGDWGVRLKYQYASDYNLVMHEVGHVFGLPDVYAFPDTINSETFDATLARPPSRMLNVWNT